MNQRRGGRRIAIIWAVATGGLGMALSGLGAIDETVSWYLQLRKPWFQPPAWAFGPAWSVIFALSAWAFIRAWRAGAGGALLAAYAINGVLNAGWTGLFFGLRRVDLAMYEVGPLWLSVLAMLVIARRHDRLAGWLLLPYLLWVAFAALINWEILRMNGPTG
jgi:tryptophan-rich sensory protein